MNYYSQKDPLWANKKLGTSTSTIGGYGCYITSLGMLLGITPDMVNTRLIKEGGYKDGNMVDSAKVAKIFNGTYEKTTTNKGIVCIAETDAFKKQGSPQHFFVLLPDGRRIDPLDLSPKPEPNDYKIVSYRNFVFDTNIFDDVIATHPFAEAIKYVKEKGLMKGSDGKFRPADPLTRAEMAQILFNLKG